MRSRAPTREVVAALRADAEVRVELVVAVVRPARRAGVRVLASLVGGSARLPCCSIETSMRVSAMGS